MPQISRGPGGGSLSFVWNEQALPMTPVPRWELFLES